MSYPSPGFPQPNGYPSQSGSVAGGYPKPLSPLSTLGGTPPDFARGMAYSSVFGATVTSLPNNSWRLLNVATLTDAFNVDFQVNANGELEYTGAGPQNFEGEILTSGRRNAGGGTNTPTFDVAPVFDIGGGGYVLGIANTMGTMETSRLPEVGFICKYSVTLNTGDKVRIQGRQNPSFGSGTHQLAIFGLDHSLILRPQ